jgi:endonuclease YncB( thermonuclease family)
MRVRRIFTPAYHPRRWGRLLTGALGAAAVAGLAVALPSDLFGTGSRGEEKRAAHAAVRVVDGETLALDGQVLRLAGVRAPSRGQICHDAAGREYDCGAAAAAALARLIAGRDVECRIQGRDGMGRPLGHCRAGGADLNASLVADGFVLAGAGSGALQALEAAARAGKRGLWATTADAEQLRRGF